MTIPAPSPHSRDPLGWFNNQPYLEPDLAVLGRQYRAWAICRRPGAAADAVLREVDRGIPDIAAVRMGASWTRLAGAALPSCADGGAVGDGVCPQQRAVILGFATHPGAQRAIDPVIGTVVRGAVVAAAVWAAADMGTARRHCHLACGCADHRPARRF